MSRSSGSCTHRCERRDQRSRSCKTFTLHLISVLAVTGSLAACANLLCLPPEQTEARLPRAAPPRPTAPAAAAGAQTRPPTPKPRPETSAPERIRPDRRRHRQFSCRLSRLQESRRSRRPCICRWGKRFRLPGAGTSRTVTAQIFCAGDRYRAAYVDRYRHRHHRTGNRKTCSGPRCNERGSPLTTAANRRFLGRRP